MPFTFSHPALILPLQKYFGKWFSLTGLMVGSMVPDFEYFLQLRTRRSFSHAIPGVFYFDLPLAFLLTFIFHGIVRNSLFNNLPDFFKRRFIRYVTFNWPKYFKVHWFIIFLSIMIGIASHLLWDGFTHIHGYFVHKIPFLQKNVMIRDFQIPYYRIFQHASSILGGFIVLIAIYRLPQQKIESTKINLTYWLFIALMSGVFLALEFGMGIHQLIAWHMVVSIMSGAMLGSILFPLFNRINNAA
ncbi:MAG TPA: DUF4184 family protein [Puia sp.]|nr:DUF4184 family protein [Puia sp.]